METHNQQTQQLNAYWFCGVLGGGPKTHRDALKRTEPCKKCNQKCNQTLTAP